MTLHVVKVNGLRTPEQRATVCYCGRAFAGWPASPWGNPFKPRRGPMGGVAFCLSAFRAHAEKQSDSWLADLWEACQCGELPLGCWCVNWDLPAPRSCSGPIVCHAQVLAMMLHERFVKEI